MRIVQYYLILKKYGVPLHPQYSFTELEHFVTMTQQDLHDDIADIYFFGGEPTIDFEQIEKLISVFDKPHFYKDELYNAH